MSNQVYFNSSDKYLAMPGYNSYSVIADSSALVPGAALQINYANPVRIVDNNQIITIGNTGIITFKEAGMYSINTSIAVQNSTPGSEMEVLVVIYDVTFGAGLVIFQQGLVGLQVNSLASTRYIPLSYTGAFQAGQTITVTITNNNASGGGLNLVVKSGSFLEITQVY